MCSRKEKLQSLFIYLILVILTINASSKLVAQESKGITGRWNLTIIGKFGNYPSWLEIRKSGMRTLVGSFVGRSGSARPISKIEFEGESMKFSIPPQWEERTDNMTFLGRLSGDKLCGETTNSKGQKLVWSAQRAPSLKRVQNLLWGKSIELFNGQDLSGWNVQFPKQENGWFVKKGILTNVEIKNNLVSTLKFKDFILSAEFRYPEGSNSGIYLRGRYELQIDDNYGKEPEKHRMGSIYGFLTPSVNAAKTAGQWQTVKITLVGRVVTVILNGELIIDRQTIPGITGGAIDNDEASPGPLMIQGDEGPIEFRKIIITLSKE